MSQRILAAGIAVKLALAWLAVTVLRAGLAGAAFAGPGRPTEARPGKGLAVLLLLLVAMLYAAVLAAVQAIALPRRPRDWVSYSATAAGLAAGIGLFVCVVALPRLPGGELRFQVLQVTVYATVLTEGLFIWLVQRAMLRSG